MNVWTKRGKDIFDPVDAAGNLRRVINGEVQVWSTEVERAIYYAMVSGNLAYATKADLDADLAHDDGTVAWVVADTEALNGIYVKSGASGSGSWAKERNLPTGPQGDVGGVAYRFDAGTADADPGAGLIRANNADLSAATELYVSKTNRYGDDLSGFLATLAGSTSTHKGYLVLTAPDSEAQAAFTVTGVTDAAGYVKLAVSGQGGATAFSDAERLIFLFSRTGNAGDLNGVNPGTTGLAVLGAETQAEARTALSVSAYVETRTALKALDTTKDTVAYLTEEGREGQFIWRSGDYSAEVAADTAEGIYIKADAIAASTGAWVRDFKQPAKASWFGEDQAAIEAAHAVVDEILIDRSFAISTTATWPNGKNYLFMGDGELAVATGVTLTIRGIVNAGIWKGLPSSAPRKIFDCAGTGKVVGIRSVKPEWWGAKSGDSAFDSSPAFNAASASVVAAALSDGARPRIEIGKGTFYLGSTWTVRPTSDINLVVEGSGSIFGTRLTALETFAGDAAFRIAGQTIGANAGITNYSVSGFSVSRVEGSSALIGVAVGEAGKALLGTQQSKIEDVFVEDFPYCWLVSDVRLVSFYRCSGWVENTANGVGLLIQTSASSSFTGDLDFWACQFASQDTTGKCVSIRSDVSGGQIKGVRFHGAIFYGGDRFVEIYASSGGIIGDVWFNPGCQWDGDIADARNMLWLEASGSGSKIDDVHVHGCYLRGVSAGYMAIRAFTDGAGAIESLFISDNWIANCADRAATIANVVGLTFDDNQFHDINNSSQAVLIDASVRWSFNGNKLTRSGSQVTPYLLSIGSGQDRYVVTGNIAGGIVSAGVIQDLSGGVNSYKAGNV